jgi:hypothetical protein
METTRTSIPSAIRGGSDKLDPTLGMTPDKTWDAEKLAAYIRQQQDAFNGFARDTAVALFRAGGALTLAKDLVEQGGYEKWLKAQSVKKTWANRAVRLFQKAKTEANVKGKNITDALRAYGIAETKKKKSSTARNPSAVLSDVVHRLEKIEKMEFQPDEAFLELLRKATLLVEKLNGLLVS